MQYISGIHALNLTCELETCGDWHQSAIQWEKPTILESESMFFKNWGIEPGHKIPDHKDETFYAANHIRALLDLLELGNYTIPQGMNNDFICNDNYDMLIFDKIKSMQALPNWKEIDRFMEREYKMKWIGYKRKMKIETKIIISDSEELIDTDDINIHEIDKIAIAKEQAYMRYDRIEDLYNIVFICNYYWDKLSKPVKAMIQDSFTQKGLEHLEYLVQTQQNKQIDNNKLMKEMLNLFDKLKIV